MATKLVSLRFDQAANLVDDPANQHARITLFKRREPVSKNPSVGSVHVNSSEWLKKDAEYLASKRRSW